MSVLDHQKIVTRGGAFRLDAELARKRESQYDHQAEDEARVNTNAYSLLRLML